MGISRRRHRHRVATVTTLAFLLLASIPALGFNPSRQLNCRAGQPGVGVRKMREEAVERFVTRRRLGGPGSWPPSCRFKCGQCGPCEPVHVPIQPGFSTPLEYYPEAWRCKCGNKIFMP